MPAHPRRSFHCQSTLPCETSARGRVGGAGGCPTVRHGIIFPASVQISRCIHHPRRSFHCRSRQPCDELAPRARWWCWWLSNYPCWDCISRRYSNSHPTSVPPQTIISLPVHTAVCKSRASGALTVLVAAQGIDARACPIQGGRYYWKSITTERRSICFTRINSAGSSAS